MRTDEVLQFPLVRYDVEDHTLSSYVVINSEAEYAGLNHDRWMMIHDAAEVQKAVNKQLAEIDAKEAEIATPEVPVEESPIIELPAGTVMVKARCRKILATSPEEIEALTAKGYRVL